MYACQALYQANIHTHTYYYAPIQYKQEQIQKKTKNQGIQTLHHLKHVQFNSKQEDSTFLNMRNDVIERILVGKLFQFHSVLQSSLTYTSSHNDVPLYIHPICCADEVWRLQGYCCPVSILPANQVPVERDRLLPLLGHLWRR